MYFGEYCMDRIIDNEIQNLLEANIGDGGRLEFIRKSLQEDKPLYNSDRKFLVNLLEKHSPDKSISLRLDYDTPIPQPSKTIPKKNNSSKKIKILFVIGITITAYFFIHGALIPICNEVTQDMSQCAFIFDIYNFTIIHIQNETIWDTGDGIGAWTGTAEGMEQHFGFLIKESLGFIFFFIIIPSIVIIGISLQKSRITIIS